MSQQISGIVPPMTTPFRADETIDERALRAETRYLIETARVHGLAVAGSTGEMHALTTDEVRAITAAVVEEARGRVPVVTGVITDSTASSVEHGLAPMPATSPAQAEAIQRARQGAGVPLR